MFSFLDDTFADTPISEEQAFTLRLAVEEIFANMVKHNEPGHEAVTLSMQVKDAALEVEMIDHGVQPFDIPDMNEKDMDDSARDGKTSGRGIYLIRQMVDDLTYEYLNGDSIVRLSIKIGSPDA